MYQGILGDILKAITRVSGTKTSTMAEESMKDYTHLFGAWDNEGRLHGLAAVLTRGARIPCPWKNGSTLLIDSLCVGPGRFVDDEPTPPKGVGTRLLKHIVRWATEHGFETIVLDTTLQAKEFYLKYGFETREWPFTKAHGWMELQNAEEQWGRILSCVKYNHVMCRWDQAPTMTHSKWKLLHNEVSHKFYGVMMAIENSEHKNDPFFRKIVNSHNLY
jgi:GNAT superfamily N-acetyltransferase